MPATTMSTAIHVSHHPCHVYKRTVQRTRQLVLIPMPMWLPRFHRRCTCSGAGVKFPYLTSSVCVSKYPCSRVRIPGTLYSWAALDNIVLNIRGAARGSPTTASAATTTATAAAPISRHVVCHCHRGPSAELGRQRTTPLPSPPAPAPPPCQAVWTRGRGGKKARRGGGSGEQKRGKAETAGS